MDRDGISDAEQDRNGLRSSGGRVILYLFLSALAVVGSARVQIGLNAREITGESVHDAEVFGVIAYAFAGVMVILAIGALWRLSAHVSNARSSGATLYD